MANELNEIETILKNRDKLSDSEAREQYRNFLSECENHLDNPFEIEELLQSELGLEPDYLEQVIEDLL